MNILKNNLLQMILVGLLFAFILGVLSFNLRSFIGNVEEKSEKQIVIVDVKHKNKINSYLNNLNDLEYLNRNVIFSQELFKSILYIKLRYKNDQRFGSNCYNFTMNLTDNSIFIETKPYQLNEKKLMDQCLDNMFNLSFNRLREKLDIYNYQDLSRNDVVYNYQDLSGNDVVEETIDENSVIIDKNREEINIERDKNITNLTDGLCENLDKKYDQILTDISLNSQIKELFDQNKRVDLSLILNLHQNLMAIQGIIRFCNNNRDTDKVSESEKLFEEMRNKRLIEEKKNKILKESFLFHLNTLNDLIDKTNFDEIFKVEKIATVIVNKPNKYLSSNNILITFSLFGFIFGFFLIYNLRS